jgi:hypothetical protein
LALNIRGGQLDQLREPHFRKQQSASHGYSTLKLIKSKYRSVLTAGHLTELVRTALTSWVLIQNYVNRTKYLVLKLEHY